MSWWIVGTGGYSRKVFQTIAARGERVCGFLDENPDAASPVAGLPACLPGAWPAAGEGEQVFVAIGRPDVRRRLMARLREEGWQMPPLVHPCAWVAPDALLGEGSFVGAQAAVESAAIIGRGCIVDTGTVVDHDARLDDFIHLRPGMVARPGAHIASEP
jgi:acetyltransferase EpsM